MNVGHHLCRKIPSRATVRGEGGVDGEGRLIGVPKFHSLGKCTMTNIHAVRLDVQFFLFILCEFFNSHLGVGYILLEVCTECVEIA